MKFLPPIWARRRPNYRPTGFAVWMKVQAFLALLCAMSPAWAVGTLGCCSCTPRQGRGRSWPYLAPQTHAWMPITLLCSTLRCFGGGCCCLLGRDALPEGAAGCFVDQRCSLSVGTGRGWEHGHGPPEQRTEKKTWWNIRLLFQCFVETENQKHLIAMIQYLKRIHQAEF